MTARMYYESDADPSVLKGSRIAVIGYGSQGHAHSLNLRDSGHDVVVGLHEGSKSRQAAAKEGLRVTSVGEAVNGADVVMILVPDTTQAKLYNDEIKPNLKSGALLMFAHGFNIHFGTITPPADVDVAMVAPKGPGHLVRSTYQDGQGVPCLFTVHQDATGTARARTIAYAHGIGGTRAGIVETTFKEETETDLFGEQSVLCGGVSSLVKAGFETLVEAGYQEEIAYFEILHELKLIVDLMYRGGLGYMRYSVSDTAEYGDYVSGPRVIGPQVKEAMKAVLKDIQEGTFAERWIDENANGRPNFTKMKAADQKHPIEKVGAEMRAKMAWLNAVTAPDTVSEASA